MANIPGNPPLSSGSFTNGKLLLLGSSSPALVSVRSGVPLYLGQRFPLLEGAANTTPIAGQIFPRGLD